MKQSNEVQEMNHQRRICGFYPNNCKFCAIKKNYNYLQQYIAWKYGNVRVKENMKNQTTKRIN